jgi:predicted DNA-binding transcriptional regulator AlpA
MNHEKLRRYLAEATKASYGCTSATCEMNSDKSGVGTGQVCKCGYIVKTMIGAANQMVNGDSTPSEAGLGRRNDELLVGMGRAAEILGVSRATLWRIVKSGALEKVEIYQGAFRLRRSDIDRLVNEGFKR